MANIETLESEIEDLKKQLSRLSKSVIPALEKQIEDSSNTKWTTIYDCSSEDEALNLGYTEGIVCGCGDLTQLPDLRSYSRVRILYYISDGATDYFEYDISDNTQNLFHMVLYSWGGSTSYMYNVLYRELDGIMRLHSHSGLKTILTYNNYPQFETLIDSTECFIKKIEVC